jgi:hypothetical protein
MRNVYACFLLLSNRFLTTNKCVIGKFDDFFETI